MRKPLFPGVILDREPKGRSFRDGKALTAKAAGDLAERHGLRGFDALPLSSAAELRAAGATGLRFSSADPRLRDAARAEGFEPA